jgi:hypothetical protein
MGGRRSQNNVEFTGGFVTGLNTHFGYGARPCLPVLIQSDL